MNDSFWNDCDALVSEALQGHDDELEPPRTVKKVMNIVKQIQVRDNSKTSRNLDRFDSSTPFEQMTSNCHSDARSEAEVKSWTRMSEKNQVSKTSRHLDRFDSSTPFEQVTSDCHGDARSEAGVKSWTSKKIQVG